MEYLSGGQLKSVFEYRLNSIIHKQAVIEPEEINLDGN